MQHKSMLEEVAREQDPELWEWWDVITTSSPPGTAENCRATEPLINESLEKAKIIIELKKMAKSYEDVRG